MQKVVPSMNPISTSSSLEETSSTFAVLVVRRPSPSPSISEPPEDDAPLRRLMGNLRRPSGVGLRVSIRSSEPSASNRRLFERAGVGGARVGSMWFGLEIGPLNELERPKPKLRAGGV